MTWQKKTSSSGSTTTATNIFQANADRPLMINGMKYEYKNQAIHPKVMYFPNKFGGYKFWMAYTPYPNGVDGYENPHIACSQDGINWGMPTGGEGLNPMDAPPADQINHTYFSDTHLTYRDDTGTLELWYREAFNGGGGLTAYERIWKRTTTNGTTWTTPQQMYQSNGSVSSILAPVLIWDNAAQLYRIWAVYNSSDLRYYESTDGTNWQFIRSTGVTGWHADVIYTSGVGYEVLMYQNATQSSMASTRLIYSVSTDLISYSAPKDVMYGRGTGAWDATLYRPSLVKVGTKYYVYYTGVNSGTGSTNNLTSLGSTWNLGLSITTKDNDAGLSSLMGLKTGDNAYFNDFVPTNPVADLPYTWGNAAIKKKVNILPQLSGTTTDRRQFLVSSSTDSSLWQGLCWFDTTLNKPFWLKAIFGGNKWYDSTGTLETFTDQAPTISQTIANASTTIGQQISIRFTATDDVSISTYAYSTDNGTNWTNYNPVLVDATSNLWAWIVPSTVVASVGTYTCMLRVKDTNQVWTSSNAFTITVS